MTEGENSKLYELEERTCQFSCRVRAFIGTKSESRNPKQIRMTEGENPKRCDLEERTYQFAGRGVRAFISSKSEI